MLIKLWTVRPATDCAILQKQGIYTADSRYVMPERMEESWERIFDLSLLPDPSIYEIQAVFWQLDPTSVVKADDFTAR